MYESTFNDKESGKKTLEKIVSDNNIDYDSFINSYASIAQLFGVSPEDYLISLVGKYEVNDKETLDKKNNRVLSLVQLGFDSLYGYSAKLAGATTFDDDAQRSSKLCDFLKNNCVEGGIDDYKNIIKAFRLQVKDDKEGNNDFAHALRAYDLAGQKEKREYQVREYEEGANFCVNFVSSELKRLNTTVNNAADYIALSQAFADLDGQLINRQNHHFVASHLDALIVKGDFDKTKKNLETLNSQINYYNEFIETSDGYKGNRIMSIARDKLKNYLTKLHDDVNSGQFIKDTYGIFNELIANSSKFNPTVLADAKKTKEAVDNVKRFIESSLYKHNRFYEKLSDKKDVYAYVKKEFITELLDLYIKSLTEPGANHQLSSDFYQRLNESIDGIINEFDRGSVCSFAQSSARPTLNFINSKLTNAGINFLTYCFGDKGVEANATKLVLRGGGGTGKTSMLYALFYMNEQDRNDRTKLEVDESWFVLNRTYGGKREARVCLYVDEFFDDSGNFKLDMLSELSNNIMPEGMGLYAVDESGKRVILNDDNRIIHFRPEYLYDKFMTNTSKFEDITMKSNTFKEWIDNIEKFINGEVPFYSNHEQAGRGIISIIKTVQDADGFYELVEGVYKSISKKEPGEKLLKSFISQLRTTAQETNMQRFIRDKKILYQEVFIPVFNKFLQGIGLTELIAEDDE